MNYTLGIDVSEWQNGQVNWTQAISQGVRFAYIRGAYGVTKDTRFDLHWGSSKGKVYRGVYLYFRDGQDPIQQAQNLYNFCAAHGDFGELPPALDIEEYGNTQITPSKVKACLEKLEQLFGVKPLVYTAKAVWDKWLGNVAWAREYDLWCSNPPYTQWFDTLIETVKSLDPALWPKKPLPWQGLMQLFWQITFKAPASMYGVPGTELDLNLFSGTEQELNDYANGTINPPPPDPEPEGETILKFTNPTQINIRSSASVVYSPSNDVGDLPANSVITALEVRPVDYNSVWVRFTPNPAWVTKTVPEYWVAMVHDNQGVLLNFHSMTPCGEGEPMTPEQLQRLEAVEAGLEALENLTSPFAPTNRLQTTKPGGEKLRAYPNGSEAVQLYDNALLMDLNQTRAGQKLVAHERNGIIITGFLDPAVIGAL